MKKYIIILAALFVAVVLAGCQSTSLTGQVTSTFTNHPKITNLEPDNGAKGVALDAPIKITFDREMDASTLNNRTVSLNYVENQGFNINPFLNSEYQFNESDYVLTITPPEKLLPNQKVEVVIREGAVDMDGKNLSYGDFTFTTGE